MRAVSTHHRFGLGPRLDLVTRSVHVVVFKVAPIVVDLLQNRAGNRLRHVLRHLEHLVLDAGEEVVPERLGFSGDLREGDFVDLAVLDLQVLLIEEHVAHLGDDPVGSIDHGIRECTFPVLLLGKRVKLKCTSVCHPGW